MRMKLLKKITAVVICLTFVTMFTACKEQRDVGTAKTNGYSVTDSKGEVTEFDTVPQKIISLLSSDTEVLFELGLDEKIIGVSTWCNYPEAATTKTQYTSGETTNVEEIIAANPDVVFIGTMGQTTEQNAQLREAGIKVIVTEAITLDDAYEVISIIGQTVGKTDEAVALIDKMKNDLNDLAKSATDKNKGNNTRRSVFIETSPLEYGLWSGGTNTFQNELLELIGATNIFSDIEGWAEVSEEQVIERNPDVIITISSETYGANGPVDEILNRENWKAINAVKNSQVFITNSDAISRPGPRLVDGAKALFDAVYSEK